MTESDDSRFQQALEEILANANMLFILKLSQTIYQKQNLTESFIKILFILFYLLFAS